MKIMDICLKGLAGDMGLAGIVGDIYSTSCRAFITAASRVVSCSSSVCIAEKKPCETARLRRFAQAGAPVQGSLAGELNGLSASTTNMTSACRSVDPLLMTCIA
jgi:hypothetical protein